MISKPVGKLTKQRLVDENSLNRKGIISNSAQSGATYLSRPLALFGP